MLWILAFHVVAVVAWFAGLFYLPRLFVYHAQNQSAEVGALFNIMQHKLYYYIMWPAAVIASILGYILLQHNIDFYRHQMWMHVKLVSAILLWGYHISLGYMDYCFQHGRNKFSEKFFRIYNEGPTILLIIIVIMVVLKPELRF
jgi:putative membrane protein